MYVELHAASAFSFLEGASVPEEMAAVCMEHGMAAMALLDRDGFYGSPRFHYAMKKAGLKAHIGSEITFSPQKHGGTENFQIGLQSGKAARNSTTKLQISDYKSIFRLPLLVASRTGYQNLCHLI